MVTANMTARVIRRISVPDYRALLIFLMLLLSAANVHAAVVHLNPDFGRLELGLVSDYYRSDSRSLNWQDIATLPDEQWQSLQQATPSLGFDSSIHWFRVQIQNTQIIEYHALLEIAYPVLDQLSVYLVSANGALMQQYELGDQQPFSARPILHRNFVVPLKLPVNDTVTLLVKVETESSVQVPLILWQEEPFYENQQSYLVAQGLYFGAVLVMSIYNIFIFISVRHRAYVYYAISVLGVAGIMASINGLGYQYLWPNNPSVNRWITPFCLSVFVGASAAFLNSLLYLDKNSPLAYRIMKSISFAYIGLIIALPLVPYHVIIQVDVVLAMMAALLAMVIGIYMLLKGVRTARYYVMASGFLWFGGIIFSLNKFGVLPRDSFTEYAIQLTSTIEIIFLSFALGDRINQERRQKYHAQQLALNNEKLARKEQERYLQLEYKTQLEELEAQQKLIESRAESRAKSEFLAIMSHEIRTPMNGMLGMAELLKDAPLSPEHRRFLSVLLSSGKSLLNIIDDILDYSKVALGKLELEAIDTDINQLCLECVDIFRVLADQSKISLSYSLSEDVPCCLRCDPTRLRQVLLNLLGNAFKFTQQGSIELRVSLEAVKAAPDNDDIVVNFEILDTGIGIEDAALKKLFQPFTQADSSINRQFGGTGLGLSISYSLVKLMGGDIHVTSQVGKGSQFSFTIRCQPGTITECLDADPQIVADEFELQQQVVNYIQQTGQSLLVVEDNAVNQLVVGGMLKKLGLNYWLAENGQQALEFLTTKHSSIFLVFMDCEMPVLDGFATTRALRAYEQKQNLPAMPVVALTAHVLPEHQQMAEQAGMNGNLAKPLSIINLLLTLQRFIVAV